MKSTNRLRDGARMAKRSGCNPEACNSIGGSNPSHPRFYEGGRERHANVSGNVVVSSHIGKNARTQ